MSSISTDQKDFLQLTETAADKGNQILTYPNRLLTHQQTDQIPSHDISSWWYKKEVILIIQ